MEQPRVKQICRAQCVFLICAILAECTNGQVSTSPAGPSSSPQPTIWTLDNVKSIGGVTPQVLGLPQVVSTPAGPAMHFNGSSDGLVFPVVPLKGWSQFTIEALIKPEPDGQAEQRFMHIEDKAGGRAMMEIRLIEKSWALDTFLLSGQSQCPLLDRTKLHPADRWTWVAMVYKDGTMTSYIDGIKELEGQVNVTPMLDGKISLGVRQNLVYWFKGSIRQVRFHPVAISPEGLQREPAK